MSPFTAVFDLDGTLVDTAADLTSATNRLLETLNLRPVTPAQLRPVVNFGARAMIEMGLRENGVGKSPAEVDALLAAFLVDYGNNIALESRPFPGAVAALGRLQEAGARLAVCTNKREALARKLLAELDMRRYFNAVTGSDTLPVKKPDAGHLIGTVILADGDLSRCVMVGDSSIDIATARAAGIPSIGVSFGFSQEPIGTLNPDLVLDHYDDLDAAIASLLPPAPRPRRGA